MNPAAAEQQQAPPPTGGEPTFPSVLVDEIWFPPSPRRRRRSATTTTDEDERGSFFQQQDNIATFLYPPTAPETQPRYNFDPTVYRDMTPETQQRLVGDIQAACEERDGDPFRLRVGNWAKKDRSTPRIRLWCASKGCSFNIYINFKDDSWYLKRGNGNRTHTCAQLWQPNHVILHNETAAAANRAEEEPAPFPPAARPAAPLESVPTFRIDATMSMTTHSPPSDQPAAVGAASTDSSASHHPNPSFHNELPASK